MTDEIIASKNRIEIIDAFRGFALVGIVLTHMVEQYISTTPTAELKAAFVTGIADTVVDQFLIWFVRGKFFALFSILFGLSFFIQMDSAAKKGQNFTGRFLWRLSILFAIGYVHSLFYRGDILTLYAMLGFVLVLFYRVSEKVFLGIIAFSFLGGFRFIIFAMNGGEPIITGGANGIELPHNIDYMDAISHGSIADVFASNSVDGHLSKIEWQINFPGRFYLTFCYFLIGLWLGRIRFFENIDVFAVRTKKVMQWSMGLTLPLFALTGFLFSQSFGKDDSGLNSWTSMFALTAWQGMNLAMTIAYLCLFVLVFRTVKGEKILSRLAPYGRTALTNYVAQSLLGTFIFFNWGLGLLGEVSNYQAFLIAIVILVLQILSSTWWMQRFRYGPLEWLWRCGTHGKLQPFLKLGGAT